MAHLVHPIRIRRAATCRRTSLTDVFSWQMIPGRKIKRMTRVKVSRSRKFSLLLKYFHPCRITCCASSQSCHNVVARRTSGRPLVLTTKRRTPRSRKIISSQDAKLVQANRGRVSLEYSGFNLNQAPHLMMNTSSTTHVRALRE